MRHAEDDQMIIQSRGKQGNVRGDYRAAVKGGFE